MHSSVLIDGILGLHRSSVCTVAAHVAIGVTGHHHRHLSVVSFAPPQARYLASRLPRLYHCFAAFADLLVASHRQPAVGKLSVLMSSRSSAVAPWLHSTCWSRAWSHPDRRHRRCRRASLRASRWQAHGQPQRALWRGPWFWQTADQRPICPDGFWAESGLSASGPGSTNS